MCEKFSSNQTGDNVRLDTGERNNTRNLRLVNLMGVSNKTLGVTLARVPTLYPSHYGYKVVKVNDDGWAKR